MEELSGFRSRRKEQRALSSPQKKHQHNLDFHASQSTPSKPSHHALYMQTGMASPSTPSPRDPFVQLDSTSTNSLSHLAPRSHVSAQSLQQSTPRCTTTESGVSSVSVCESTCHAASLRRHNDSIDDFSLRRVSLEQHLQQSDAGREEAMHNFILERFLPAAKIVAADHDHATYSAGKHRIPELPSTVQHPSSSGSTMKVAPVHSQKSIRSPSTLNAPESAAWSYRPRPCGGEGYNEGVSHEMPAKSCGFFCAGLKSAMLRAHNIAHASTHSMPKTESRATQSSSHGTSSDEEKVPSKIKVRMQDTQKRRGDFMPVLESSSLRSPTTATIHEPLPRHDVVLNKSFPRGPSCDPVYSNTHFDSTRLLSLCIKCHSNSSSHQPPIQRSPQEYVRDGNSSRQSLQTLRPIRPGNDVSSNCHCDGVKQTLGESSENDYSASNSNVASEDPDSQANMRDSPEHRNLSVGALRDRYYPEDCLEDDELEFYDAVSRFDSPTSTIGNAPSSQRCSLTKSQNVTMIWSANEHDLVAIHDSYARKEETLVFDDGGLTLPLASKHSCGSVSRVGNDVCARPRKNADSLNSNSYRMSTPMIPKKSLSSPVLGWPLGISSFQSATSRDLRQEPTTYDAKMVQERGKCDGKGNTNSNISCTKNASPREGSKDCNKCVVNPSFSLEVLSPPIPPPSPTTSSWLGKALAMKASKPSYLATLQEQKVVSCKKKLEFTSPSSAKKGVRWEDMVKGSQMHPEQ